MEDKLTQIVRHFAPDSMSALSPDELFESVKRDMSESIDFNPGNLPLDELIDDIPIERSSAYGRPNTFTAMIIAATVKSHITVQDKPFIAAVNKAMEIAENNIFSQDQLLNEVLLFVYDNGFYRNELLSSSMVHWAKFLPYGQTENKLKLDSARQLLTGLKLKDRHTEEVTSAVQIIFSLSEKSGPEQASLIYETGRISEFGIGSKGPDLEKAQRQYSEAVSLGIEAYDDLMRIEEKILHQSYQTTLAKPKRMDVSAHQEAMAKLLNSNRKNTDKFTVETVIAPR